MKRILGARVWDSLSQWWQSHFGLSPSVLENLLNTILVLTLYVILRALVARLIVRRIEDVTRRYMVGRTIKYVLGLLCFLILAKIWLVSGLNLGTFLGLLSAGLAIALQDLITNLAGWLFLIIRQPFRVGDRIQVVGGPAGDVIDIRLFMFSVVEIGNWVAADQSTGRIIHLPNNIVFKQGVANYTQGFQYIWHELPVTVTFESDWRKAHEILTRIVKESTEQFSEDAARQIRRAAEKYMIFYKHLSPIVWVSVADIGVTLTIRYMCDSRRRRSTEGELWKAILEAFAQEPEIDFAYPTQRFYNNRLEGKPGTGGPPASQEGGVS